MENQETQSTEVQEHQTPAPQEGAETPRDYEAEIRKLREEAARYRTERNELREDAEQWRATQEAEKSELQRAQEAMAAREKELADERLKNARLTAANQYGIAEENLDLLGAGSPEEIADRARRLAEMQKAAQVAAPPSDTPRVQLKPGTGDEPPAADNAFPSDWIV